MVDDWPPALSTGGRERDPARLTLAGSQVDEPAGRLVGQAVS
jgi:hypothetical protein